MRPIRSFFAAFTALLLALGCAAGRTSWDEVRREDSVVAYHRYLRENPKAPQAAEARERLALARLRKDPSAEGYVAFRAEYPDSDLLAEIRPQLEAQLFERAMARGTRDAYTEYLAEFPTGSYAERARGNAEYLRENGFDGRPADLAAFAERHPTSDFAVEARRSVESLDARRQGVLRRIGLVLEVDPKTPGADRLERSFAQRALRHFSRMSVELVALRGATDPNAARVDAVLTIHHSEVAVKADFENGRSTTPGIEATTVVTLARPADPVPIASEEFRFKAKTSDWREGESVLFGPTAKRYWDDFFFPLTTWNSKLAVRRAFPLRKSAVAVDAEEYRAVALFDDGSFEVVDISDPANPRISARYVRPKDLSQWNGLRIHGDRVAIFGEAGVEVLDLAAGEPQRVLDLDRAKVGGVVAAEPAGEDFVVAGSRGILLARPGSEPQLLLEMNVVSAAMRGDRLIFTDGDLVYAASLGHLRRQKAEGQLRIGAGFGIERIRVFGNDVLVLGDDGILVIDATQPARLAIRTRINTQVVGEIHDAIESHGHIFILGSRGLQVADARAPRVEETVDVLARDRVGVAGRHLVMVGDGKLQVVDTTPFTAVSGVASPGR